MKRKEFDQGSEDLQNARRENRQIWPQKITERHAPRESHREIDRARVDARVLRRQVVCDVL